MKWVSVLGLAVALTAAIGLAALVGLRPVTPADQTNAVEVIMTEMRFSPNRIDARVGQSVVITIVNRGSQRHDLAFTANDMPGMRAVETLTLPGRETTLSISFEEPGAYRFVCTIPGHAVAGMTGAIFVSR